MGDHVQAHPSECAHAGGFVCALRDRGEHRGPGGAGFSRIRPSGADAELGRAHRTGSQLPYRLVADLLPVGGGVCHAPAHCIRRRIGAGGVRSQGILEAAVSATNKPLLEIKGLKTGFKTEAGWVKAVDGVSFDLYPGEVVGLVGESGSGKSVTALSVLRLIPDPPGRIVEGSILYRGRDLLKLSWEEMRGIR